MILVGYSALELKNSGMVMACPMPMSRSRCSAIPAIVIDRQEKKAEPRTRNPALASSFSGLSVSATPSRADRITTTMPCMSDRTPAANALPVTARPAGWG